MYLSTVLLIILLPALFAVGPVLVQMIFVYSCYSLNYYVVTVFVLLVQGWCNSSARVVAKTVYQQERLISFSC